MKTMTMMSALALVMMTGCMAEEEQGAVADDVASQESAVEEAPAPQPDEDLSTIRWRCGNICQDQNDIAHGRCDATYSHGAWQMFDAWADCVTEASQANAACDAMCSRVWGDGHGDIGTP